MSYENGNYNGVLYIGFVKWSDDYKNCMLFDSKTQRDTFLKNHLIKQEGNIGILERSTSYIDVEGKLSDLENANYLYYSNSSDISSTFFCCFITDYAIIAKNTTRLYIKLDVFQQYIYDTTFYNCILERAHISKSIDNSSWYKYTAPEPIGFQSTQEKNIDVFSDISFAPVLVMDTASKPDSLVNTTYLYGGKGDGANATGMWRFKINGNVTDKQAFVSLWGIGEYNVTQQGGTNISHINDIVGFSFIPNWVDDNSSWSATGLYTGSYELNNNSIAEISDTASIGQTFAVNYTPDNKKLYNSLGRSFRLWNKNGLSIPLKPEQLESQSGLKINLSMRPMGSTYKLEIEGYKDFNTKFIDLPYSYNIAMGINSNVGTAQQTAINNLNNQSAVLKASQNYQQASMITGAIGGVIGAAGSAASGNWSGLANSLMNLGTSTPKALAAVLGGIPGMLLANDMSEKIDNFSAQNLLNQNIKADNFNMQTAINDAYSSITKTIGNNSNRTNMSNDFNKIRLSICSPTLEELRIIDDFLSVYGYSIQEIRNPETYLHTRSNWNYIKTNGCNISVKAPTVYENTLKNIFDSGLTVWHKYDDFGNYELSNT